MSVLPVKPVFGLFMYFHDLQQPPTPSMCDGNDFSSFVTACGQLSAVIKLLQFIGRGRRLSYYSQKLKAKSTPVGAAGGVSTLLHLMISESMVSETFGMSQ